MKFHLPVLVLFCISLSAASQSIEPTQSGPPARTKHLFIITIDGFRWQEVFTGADPSLIANENYVRDTSLARQLYWDTTAEARRKKLMPFFWTTIAEQGRLYGNRYFGNKVNVRNFYKISYPGYNEIFTGHTDAVSSPNLPIYNKHVNVLEYLNASNRFHGKVAVFTSWSVFPFILNDLRSGLPINSGYSPLGEDSSEAGAGLIDSIQTLMHPSKTRHDLLTYLSATEYIHLHHPSVVYIGLGETDEFAHQGRYDLYLQDASHIDRMIAELWYNIQTDPYYKDNTTLLITTDHGRGWKPNKWTTHGFWAQGSGEIWLALLGPGIPAEGELRTAGQIYQRQFAATMADLLGNPAAPGHPPGKPIFIPALFPGQTPVAVSAHANGTPAVQSHNLVSAQAQTTLSGQASQ